MIEKIVAYILHVRRIQRKFEYEPGNIIAMDETPMWNNSVPTTTVNSTGKRDVPLKTTGHEKVRVSVVLSAKGDATKLKPMMVFGVAKRDSKALHGKLLLLQRTVGWMNNWPFAG